MNAGRAHHETAVEREADRMQLAVAEQRAMAILPMLLAGLSASTIDDVGVGLAIAVTAGIFGVVITLAMLQLFHDRRWPRPYAYATALALFVGVALVPIILFGEAIGPTVGRMLR